MSCNSNEAKEDSLGTSCPAVPAPRRLPPRESTHGSGLPSSAPVPVAPSSTEEIDWNNRDWDNSPPAPKSPDSVNEENVASFEEITLEMLALQNHDPIQIYYDVVSGADFSRLVREFKERIKYLSRLRDL
ncbi:hypothetical protein GCK72_003795 [Caenorhabditis remanei]|uniref:Uncharacterized protein n=1 Tax=Caenorhabditis remanei TaxID=31234 RepID=A0A6A5H9Z5_CAERE|nr:hypothetical protein GCK72_003795 [Caenorhabditis remanei]KAF1763849.1 hypothetical protein GCK72_003795 [Caenorhabditis remanei]